MRCALHVEPPVVHLGNVPKVRCEPAIVADPDLRKGVVDEKTSLAGFDVVVQGKHRLPLEYTTKL